MKTYPELVAEGMKKTLFTEKTTTISEGRYSDFVTVAKMIESNRFEDQIGKLHPIIREFSSKIVNVLRTVMEGDSLPGADGDGSYLEIYIPDFADGIMDEVQSEFDGDMGGLANPREAYAEFRKQTPLIFKKVLKMEEVKKGVFFVEHDDE